MSNWTAPSNVTGKSILDDVKKMIEIMERDLIYGPAVVYGWDLGKSSSVSIGGAMRSSVPLHPNCQCVPVGITASPGGPTVKFNTVKEDPSQPYQTIAATMDVSEHELRQGTGDVIRAAKRRLVDRLANEFELMMIRGDLDTLVRETAKEVIRELLTKDLKDRVEDLLEEL